MRIQPADTTCNNTLLTPLPLFFPATSLLALWVTFPKSTFHESLSEVQSFHISLCIYAHTNVHRESLYILHRPADSATLSCTEHTQLQKLEQSIFSPAFWQWKTYYNFAYTLEGHYCSYNLPCDKNQRQLHRTKGGSQKTSSYIAHI